MHSDPAFVLLTKTVHVGREGRLIDVRATTPPIHLLNSPFVARIIIYNQRDSA